MVLDPDRGGVAVGLVRSRRRCRARPRTSRGAATRPPAATAGPGRRSRGARAGRARGRAGAACGWRTGRRRRRRCPARRREPSGPSAARSPSTCGKGTSATTTTSGRVHPTAAARRGHAAVARVAAQDHLEQLAAQPQLLAGALGLLLRVALRARRRQLVDVGEERLPEREQRVGRHLRHVDRARDGAEGDARAVAVGGEQRLEAPARAHLAATEALVDPLAVLGQRRQARARQVEEAVERDRDALAHPLPEAALHRHRIDGDVTGYALDDRLDDVPTTGRSTVVTSAGRDNHGGSDVSCATSTSCILSSTQQFLPSKSTRSPQDRGGASAAKMEP